MSSKRSDLAAAMVASQAFSGQPSAGGCAVLARPADGVCSARRALPTALGGQSYRFLPPGQLLGRGGRLTLLAAVRSGGSV